MTQLAPAGTDVSIGVSIGVAGYEVLIDMARMRRAPVPVCHLDLYQELEREPASVGLQRLFAWSAPET